MVRSIIGQSQMDLGQRNINFGNLDQNDKRTKRIIITNKSGIPLMYNIVKSGSVASGDISIPTGKSGVVRGFSRKEVEFLFTPTLTGPFQEKLVIENVQNPESDQSVILKSNIRKPPNFHVENLILEMGPYSCEQPSTKYRYLTLSNTSSKQARVFEVRVDPSELIFGSCICEVYFSLNAEANNEGDIQYFLTKDLVEKIEQLEQKLKIATRKGREDKADKIKEQLLLLRAGKDEFFSHANGHELESGNADSLRPDTKMIKATNHSLIFPVGPRQTKTLKVFFRAKLLRTEVGYTSVTMVESSPANEGFDSPSLFRDSVIKESEEHLPEICTIPIYISEQKNQDTTKKVLLRATVCPTMHSYLICSEAYGVSPGLDENVVAHIPLESAEENFGLEISSPNSKESAKKSLVVDTAQVDLGKIELGEIRDCYYIVTNTTGKRLKYYTTVNSAAKDLVGKLENHGSLNSHEVKQVNFSIKPKVLGRGLVSLRVRSSNFSDETIVVKYIFFVVLPGYLEFATLGEIDCQLMKDPVVPSAWELDLKYCFVDQKTRYSKIIPLCVKNISKAGCYIAISSNVTQQCAFFVDRALETPVDPDGLFIQRGDCAYVYIALQSNSGTSATYVEARNFIAGIKFLVYVPERFDQNHFQLSGKLTVDPHGRVLAYTHKLKLTATIGQSQFALDQKVLDVGCDLTLGQTFTGSIRLKNIKPRMPLLVHLSSSQGSLTLSAKEIFIEPSDSGDSDKTAELEFYFECKKPGYFSETIIITNMHNSSQEESVKITGFVDPQRMKASRVAEDSFKLSASIIEWKDQYISENSDDSVSPIYQLNSQDTCETVIELENTSGQGILIQPLCSLDLDLNWFGEPDDSKIHSRVSKAFQGLHICGRNFLIKPSSVARFGLSVPRPNKKKMDILTQSKGTLHEEVGILLLRDLISNDDVKMFKVCAVFKVSLGDITPKEINLGHIGYTTSWKPVPLSFKIANLSSIALHYKFETEPFINAGSITKSSIIPTLGETEELQLVLKPRLIPQSQSGENHTILRFLNKFNPWNKFDIPVTYFMTQFALRCDRLDSGEIMLASLKHPAVSESQHCDSWFTVTNLSDHEVQFEISCIILPEIQKLLNVQVLLKVTNVQISPIMKLGPTASIDLKVSVQATKNTRLSMTIPQLKTLKNLPFGHLCIDAKSAELIDDNENDSMRETIPLKGGLIDRNLCKVQPETIYFQLENGSDSETENENVGETEINSYAEQLQVFTISNLSSLLPVRVKIVLRNPVEFSATAPSFIEIEPLNKPDEYFKSDFALVKPNSVASYCVRIKKSNLFGISDDIYIDFYDLDSVGAEPVTVSVKFREIISGSEPIFSPGMENLALTHFQAETFDSSPIIGRLSSALSYISPPVNGTFDLKGCKRQISLCTGKFEGLYLLEVGTVDASAAPLVKKLSLEYRSGGASAFQIISAVSDAVMSFNKTEGTISQDLSSSFTLLVNLNCNRPGKITEYFSIKNTETPTDTKYVRVSYEVIAKQTITRRVSVAEPVFTPAKENNIGGLEIFCRGKGNVNVIDAGVVMPGVLCCDRYIEILNTEIKPIDISVIVDIPEGDNSEVYLSTDPGYVNYPDQIQIRGSQVTKLYVNYVLFPDPSNRKQYQIRIVAKFLKDYTKTLFFEAECMDQYSCVDKYHLDLRFSLQGKLLSQNPAFTVVNHQSSIANYFIFNQSPYFNINREKEGDLVDWTSCWNSQKANFASSDDMLDKSTNIECLSIVVSQGSPIQLCLGANYEKIDRDREQLKKEKYLKDYIIIIDRNSGKIERLCLNICFGSFTGFLVYLIN